MNHKKGQGALEYLLLIGGAILVAVVVITILSGIGGAGGSQAEYTAAQGICANRSIDSGTCTASEAVVGGTGCDCIWNATNFTCSAEAQTLCVTGDA